MNDDERDKIMALPQAIQDANTKLFDVSQNARKTKTQRSKSIAMESGKPRLYRIYAYRNT